VAQVKQMSVGLTKKKGANFPAMTRREAEDLRDEANAHPYFSKARTHFRKPSGHARAGWEVVGNARYGDNWVWRERSEWVDAKHALEDVLGVPGARAQRPRE
jgi:hypothetical protein